MGSCCYSEMTYIANITWLFGRVAPSGGIVDFSTQLIINTRFIIDLSAPVYSYIM
jgi:hypothetical protein